MKLIQSGLAFGVVLVTSIAPSMATIAISDSTLTSAMAKPPTVQLAQAPADEIEGLIREGAALLDADRDAEALVVFDRVIELNPEIAVAWLGRGFALLGLERYEEAVVAYDQVIQLDSSSEVAWLQRGKALGALQQYQAALDSFEQAIGINPDNEWAWYYKALSLAYLERYDEAIVSLEQTLSLDPTHAEAQELLRQLQA